MESQVYIAICEDVEAELKLLAEYVTSWGKSKGIAGSINRWYSATIKTMC